MQHIDLHNYEAFLLDYSEGNLNAEEIVLLKSFVLEHPELEIDLSDFNLPYITQETEVADFKSALKKHEEELQDEELINYLEGNLSKKDKRAFETKLGDNPELAKDLADYKKTRLAADTAEIYNHKSDLKKTEDDFILINPSLLYIEKQLSGTEQLQYEKELKSNPDLKKEFVLVSKTLLASDESIVYPDKETLKKKNKVVVLFSLRSMGSMAAAVLLLFGLVAVFKFYNTQKSNEVQLSIVEPKDLSIPKAELPEESNAKTTVHPKQENQRVEKSVVDQAKTIRQSSKTLAKIAIEKQSPVNKDIPQLPAENNIIERDRVKAEKNIEKPIEKQQATLIASNATETLVKHNYLLLAEDIMEEVDLDSEEDSKKGFWKRAVHLAKQVNNLGVKSIDGEEDSKNKFRLSFNSFSVEKK